MSNIAINQPTKRFDGFDWGWLVVSFGMALGAGIVLVPVSVGVVGLTIYLISAVFAYPAIFLFQRLYMNTLFENKESKCYSAVIKDLLGQRWGVVLGFLYFVMMLIWTVIYAEVVAKSIGNYLYQYGIINIPHLDDNMFYSLFLMAFLVFVGAKSQKLLFKASTVLTITLLVVVLIVSFAIIPQWNMANAAVMPSGSEFLTKTIIMFPFSLTTILFIQSLSPMVMGYREKYPQDNELARYKAQRTMKIAFFILLAIVGFYVFSFAMVIPQDQALLAKNNNDSVFTLMAHIHPSNITMNVLGIIINICAILAAFLSILSGMRESLRGVVMSVVRKFFNEDRVSKPMIEQLIIGLIIVMTWLSIVYHIPIFYLVPLCGPIFGIIGCLIPAYMVYKVPSLHKYKTLSLYYVIFVGVVLCVSPFLMSALS